MILSASHSGNWRQNLFVLLSRFVLFALIWWLLSGGTLGSWLIGAPAALLAAYFSVLLLPATGVFWLGLLRFIPFFIFHSLLGGWYVAQMAWRTTFAQMPLTPAVVEYDFRLPPGISRVFMTGVVSLLPGSLSAELGETSLRVHVLDANGSFYSELRLLEQRVAELFNVRLNQPNQE